MLADPLVTNFTRRLLYILITNGELVLEHIEKRVVYLSYNFCSIYFNLFSGRKKR